MSVTDTDLTIDHRLSEISDLLPVLLSVTPTNVAQARERFLANGMDEPAFTYRPLPHLERLESDLDDVPVGHASDPVLSHLFRAKQRELGLRIRLLRNRSTDDFLPTSVELFGHAEPSLVDDANGLLTLVGDAGDEPSVGAPVIAERVERELDHYRRVFPELNTPVRVGRRYAGVLVERGEVLIGATARVDVSRLEGLVHHEVGTHVLTYVNGAAQPLRLLRVGLAGYEELQESLGLIAEHLAGALGPRRLRILAARVIAVASVVTGASFRETFAATRDAGLGSAAAFMTTMRAHRGGGFTKDIVYLRGLGRLLRHLAEGGELTELYVGKVSLEEAPLIADLRRRAVLVTPPLTPRYLTGPRTDERLRRLRNGLEIRDLVEAL